MNKVAFFFLLQLSCAWQQVPWLQQALASAQFSSSSLLQNRHNILRAVSLLQVRSHAAYPVQKEVTDWIVPSPFLSCVWLFPFVESTLVPVFIRLHFSDLRRHWELWTWDRSTMNLLKIDKATFC